jgi:hypothetical protein
MDVFGNWTVRTVVNAKFHALSLIKRPETRVDGALVHLQVYYSMFAGDSSNSAVLIKMRQRSSHICYPFPEFDTESNWLEQDIVQCPR